MTHDFRRHRRHVLKAGASLAAGALGLDDHHAGRGDSLVSQGQQPRLEVFGQGRGGDVEAQVDGGGHFVDVLPAGALGADGGQFDFGQRDDDRRGNRQYRGGIGRGVQFGVRVVHRARE